MEVPDNDVFENGFKASGSSSSATSSRTPPHPFDLLAGARGCSWPRPGWISSRTGRRIDLPELALPASAARRRRADAAVAAAATR